MTPEIKQMEDRLVELYEEMRAAAGRNDEQAYRNAGAKHEALRRKYVAAVDAYRQTDTKGDA